LRHFTNKELTRLYGVSDKTIRNWIAASLSGDLDLKLIEHGKRSYIADSTANNYLLEKLAQRGRKYRNSTNHKVVQPSDEFKELFAPEHIIDIANTLDNHHELSWSHSYFGRAGVYWNQYLNELYDAGKPNMITNSIETLDLSQALIDAHIAKYKKVNIVNVAVGNNNVLRKLVANLHERKKLDRFIAIDISPTILDIAEKNCQEWFNGAIALEKHLLDIRHHTFYDVLSRTDADTTNLIFFTAGPLHNFKDPRHLLRNFHNSMSRHDLLFTAIKRNTNQTKRFFDFNIKSDGSLLGVRRKMLLDLLNIDEKFYEVEQVLLHDSISANSGTIQVRLKVDLTINFETSEFKKTVELHKGETILLWFAKRYDDVSLIELFEDSGLSVVQVLHSLDRQLTMQISRMKTFED
jgi:L-histidine N-alpha-methyltransferase